MVTLCKKCGGDGEIHIHRWHDCWDCNGVGLQFNKREIPYGMVPNEEGTELIKPCCDIASKHWITHWHTKIKRQRELDNEIRELQHHLTSKKNELKTL